MRASNVSVVAGGVPFSPWKVNIGNGNQLTSRATNYTEKSF
ncbi:hypothetical protein P4V41_13550 [Fictibacillus nanhaiensis]|nr:hypothetical protein [Fictibacillus nanhaiensis]